MAKGGTGVFSVDGKEVANKSIGHTIPVLMTFDETFDIGSSKVDFKLGPSQMLPEANSSGGASLRGLGGARIPDRVWRCWMLGC